MLTRGIFPSEAEYRAAVSSTRRNGSGLLYLTHHFLTLVHASVDTPDNHLVAFERGLDRERPLKDTAKQVDLAVVWTARSQRTCATTGNIHVFVAGDQKQGKVRNAPRCANAKPPSRNCQEQKHRV